MKARSILALASLCVLVPFTASAVDVLMPGRSGLVRFANDGTLKTQKSISKALKNTSFLLPAAGGPDDPRLVGGTYRRCIIGQTAPCETIPLNAGQWIALGNPAGIKGFKYRGFGGPSDPCSVVLKRNKLRVVCKGDGGIDDDFVLPVGTSSVGDELVIGSIRYCNQFDPPYKKDGGVKPIWKKKVKGSQVQPPTECPQLDPAYGSAVRAFVDVSSSLLE